MKIAIDAAFGKQNLAGLEVWTREFVKSIADEDVFNQYIIFGYFWRNFNQRKKMVYVPEKDNFSLYLKRMPKSLLTYLEDHGIPIIENWLKRKGVEIFHGTGFFLPCLKEIKGVVTIHGLDFKEMDAYWYNEPWYKNVPLYLKRAYRIISVSRYVKNSLVKYYGLLPEKIQVIYPGIRKNFTVITDETKLESFREKFKISQPYILTVATSDERKNLKGILNVFSHIKNSEPNLKLVIVGDKEVIQTPILSYIEKLGLMEEVYFPGYLKSDELVYFYNLAEVFIFPSLYEGFGMPVIEAMACGCPVVTSNVSALPEVVDDSALLVDPYKLEEIFDAIKLLLKEKSLHEELKNKGLERAKFFSWEKCAKKTLEIYKGMKL